MAERLHNAEKEYQIYGQILAEMAKKHPSEAFYALEDPLEAAVFSVLVEMMRDSEKMRKIGFSGPHLP